MSLSISLLLSELLVLLFFFFSFEVEVEEEELGSASVSADDDSEEVFLDLMEGWSRSVLSASVGRGVLGGFACLGDGGGLCFGGLIEK